MGEIPIGKRAIVTAHAVTRYVQRVEGVVLDLDERLFGATFVMVLHLFAAGLTREEVESRILKRPIIEAMADGLTEQRYGRFVAVIEGRFVITIAPYRPEATPIPHLQVRSKREVKRAFRRIHLQRKRAPVA